MHTFGNGVALRTSGTQTIAVYDAFHPTIIGSANVNVGGGAAPEVLTTGGKVGSTGAVVQTAVGRQPRQSQARGALAASSHRTTASAARARAIAQANLARDHILVDLEGNLRAYLMTERLAASRLE